VHCLPGAGAVPGMGGQPPSALAAGDSWYGSDPYRRPTASHESCSRHERLASDRTLPLDTQVGVTIIDRGSYADPSHRMDIH
jgi:hypothetical protein